MTPFIKWAGGKRGLLPQILPHVPKFRRYFEPFAGGAALFFELGARARGGRLSDTNTRLIRAYRGLRDHTDEVIHLLASCPYDRRFFEDMRERHIDAAADAEVAAWFIYLNKTGFNGLYRVNADNRFNVPFGKYARPTICDGRTLRACAAALEGAHLATADFEDATRDARAGDFVYFDPPYVPLSETSSFTSYTAARFGMQDHERLRDVAKRLVARGVHVVLSNSSAPVVRRLYKGFLIKRVSARRSINSKTALRKAVTELLIVGRERRRKGGYDS